MAIRLTAKKGGFTITDGYLIITQVTIQKYLRPDVVPEVVENSDGTTSDVLRPVVVNAVMYIARGQVYPSQEAREKNFGATDMNFAFSFEHEDGQDPVAEAYASIRANGLPGWVLTGMVDA